MTEDQEQIIDIIDKIMRERGCSMPREQFESCFLFGDLKEKLVKKHGVENAHGWLISRMFSMLTMEQRNELMSEMV